MQSKAFLIVSILLFVGGSQADPLGTAFTYQGELKQLGAPASGQYDFRFEMFDIDVGGSPIASPVLLEDVDIVEGIFTVDLDFGSLPYSGDQLWLGIGVSNDASVGGYTSLMPRQRITAVPYALHAEYVAMNAVGSAEVDSNQVQLRVGSSCSTGSSIRSISVDGTVICETDNVGLTNVISSNIVDETIAAIDVDSSQVQLRVGSSCTAGSSIQSIASDGTVTCETDDVGLTSVTGSDIVDATVAAADVDSSEIQLRVGASCEPGSSIRSIAANGVVTCENDDLGLTNFTCPAGQAFVGLGADGSVNCALLVTYAVTPTAGANGTVTPNTVQMVNHGTAALFTVTPDNSLLSAVVSGTCGGILVGEAFTTPAVTGDCSVDVSFQNSINTVDGSAQFTSIAIGSDGLPVIAYKLANRLTVAKCNDVACAGGDETITILDGDTNSSHISIANGADGLPVISYQGVTGDSERWVGAVLRVAKCNDLACTGSDETFTTVDDPANDVGNSSVLTIGDDGFPIISYVDDTVGAIKVAKCNDAACAGGDETITTVIDVASNLQSPSLAIAADGLPVIAFDAGSTLWVAKCNDAACAGGDETITTAVGGPGGNALSGNGPAIAISTDGLPVIIYRASSTRIDIVKCNDAACAGGDETITFSVAQGNAHTIVIGADGLPVISSCNNGLSVVACNDAACAGGDEATTNLANAGNTCSHPSLAIGPDTLPVISYSGSNGLSVAKCGTPSCQ